jgi:outer membrane protein OmpA-like peptidoglycan-associated protein
LRRPTTALLLLAAALSSAPAVAQRPGVEVGAAGVVVLPAGARPGSGWRLEGAFPVAPGFLPRVQLAVGDWRSTVRRDGDPAVGIPIRGELRSSFVAAALRLDRAGQGYLTSLSGGLAVHLTRADLTRDPPAGEEEVRALAREMEGVRAGPVAALTLVRRPLLGPLHAELTLRRSWVPGIEPWELTAGLALGLGRAPPLVSRLPRAAAPAGAAAPVPRPSEPLIAALAGVAARAGFEVVDADDDWRVVVAGDAFPSGSAVLPAEVRASLAELGGVLAPAAAQLRVIGHTDHTGSERVNQRLSERRALAVRDALLAGGLDPERISALGYGSALPRASGETAAGRAANRRVEIVVSGG